MAPIFVGASHELAELAEFLNQQISTGDIPDFCASRGIRWNVVHFTLEVSDNPPSRA